MKSIGTVIAVATLYLIVYVVIAHLEFSWSVKLTLFLFSLSPLPVIWMAWRILRDDYTSPYKFSERFYLDVDKGPYPLRER